MSTAVLMCLKTFIYKDFLNDNHPIDTLFDLWRVSRDLHLERLEKMVRIRLRKAVDPSNCVRFAILSIQNELKQEIRSAIQILKSDIQKYSKELESYPSKYTIPIMMAYTQEFVEEDILVSDSTLVYDLSRAVDDYLTSHSCGCERKISSIDEKLLRLQEKVDFITMQ
eukprot:TRINITY_DN7916_c0_g1_i1.p1 TRINITY_DN7916_c0_g1~~TRINITY_DN7916_c0_g1_i1.p1  ORF type:complete len:185 (+),score=12.19 TRINITY_DN7916_c0_g1_i1:53-556(+)